MRRAAQQILTDRILAMRPCCVINIGEVAATYEGQHGEHAIRGHEVCMNPTKGKV